MSRANEYEDKEKRVAGLPAKKRYEGEGMEEEEKRECRNSRLALDSTEGASKTRRSAIGADQVIDTAIDGRESPEESE
jgi:hypothetical protein